MAHDPWLETKLRTIVPYLVSARHLPRQPRYLAHTLYAYTRDALAAVVGFGASSPILRLATGEAPGGPEQLASLPTGPMGVAAVGALGAWGALKFYATRDDGDKRATLARSCVKEFRRIQVKVYQALEAPDPMPALNDAYTQASNLVDRHINEDSWPWTPHAPGIAAEVERDVAEMLKHRQPVASAGPPPQDGAPQQKVAPVAALKPTSATGGRP